MKDGINVLSLFDGMSGGQQALDRLGVKVNKYYASEIDKYAIAVTQYNYPDTIQLGDITKWKEWDIDWESIDLVIGGFPCQAWSVAGKQLGDRDERGKLFWVMLDVMRKTKEKNSKGVILIENVKMKRDFETYITKHVINNLGDINKYLIDSSLVSAQMRKRYYWTNVNSVDVPSDKGIVLQDILIKGEFITDREKSYTIDDNYGKGGNLYQYFVKKRRQLVFRSGPSAITAKAYALRAAQEASITNSVIERYFDRHIGNVVVEKERFRLLLPIECERLQTVEDDYTKYGNFDGKVKEISKTQRYKILGNGWTIDVIAHIFSFIPQIKSGEWVKK